MFDYKFKVIDLSHKHIVMAKHIYIQFYFTDYIKNKFV